MFLEKSEKVSFRNLYMINVRHYCPFQITDSYQNFRNSHQKILFMSGVTALHSITKFKTIITELTHFFPLMIQIATKVLINN